MHPDRPECPESVLALIPWYPDLDGDDCGLVEAHAAECRVCRCELELVRGGPIPTSGLPDRDRLFAKIVARLERGRAERSDEPRSLHPRLTPGALLEVMFRPGVVFARVERSLREVGARIVDGPCRLGRFRVALRADANPATVARWLLEEAAIASSAVPITV